MINVEITAVERTNFEFTHRPDVNLKEIPKAKQAVLESLVNNPLNRGFISQEANFNITLMVTIAGDDYNNQVPWASIDYDFFLTHKSKVILDFHLIKFIGDDREYACEIPTHEVLLYRNTN
jgi:hypothetical protein